MAKKVLTYTLSEPLHGARSAQANIQMTDGNLVLDGFTGAEPELTRGELEYLENQDPPERSISGGPDATVLTLKAGRQPQPWIHFPWATCNGATNWRIHLHPAVTWEIQAQSGGGNITLDLSSLDLSGLTAGTGGGNLTASLPAPAAAVSVALRSGAGNVTVQVPSGTEIRVQAASGLGKIILPPHFQKVQGSTYQTPGYDRAAERYDFSLTSGAGNVKIEERVPQPAAATPA